MDPVPGRQGDAAARGGRPALGAAFLTSDSFLEAQAASLRQLGERLSPVLAELPPGLHPTHLRLDAPRLPVAELRQRLQDALLGVGGPIIHLDLTGASTPAQTAILAVAELSLPGLRLVMLTSEPGSILPTLRSRCYRWRMPPLPRSVFEALVVEAGGSGEQAANLPDPYPGTLAEAVHETRTDRGPIDALMRALALRDPVACIIATEGFGPAQALLLGLLIRRHLSNLLPVTVFTMLRMTPDVLAAWAEALTHHTIPPQAAARWGALLALSRVT